MTRVRIAISSSGLLVLVSSLFLSGCVLTPFTDTAGAGDGVQSGRSSSLNTPLRITPLADAQDVSTNYARFSWTAVAGAVQYDVHLGPDTNPPTIATVEQPSLLVRELPACTPHYWRVVAVLGDGKEVSSVTWKFTTRCDGP